MLKTPIMEQDRNGFFGIIYSLDFHYRFVRVAYSNMIQCAPIIAPTHSNTLVRMGTMAGACWSMLKYETRTNLVF